MENRKRILAMLMSLVMVLSVMPQGLIRANGVEEAAAYVVISQIYGGGGNKGASYKNDFIELYNPTSKDVDLTGWSVQYASTKGAFSDKTITPLEGTIKANGYYLIQEAAGSNEAECLPNPDCTGEIGMASGAAKIALVKDQTVILDSQTDTVVDFVGYGSGTTDFEGTVGPGTSNTTSIVRKIDWIDTDDNGNDFKAVTPNPRNSQTPINVPNEDGQEDEEDKETTFKITHKVPGKILEGESVAIKFSTSMPVTTSSVYVVLEGKEEKEFKTGSGSEMELTIPREEVKGTVLNYYIKATNEIGTVRKPEEGTYSVRIETPVVEEPDHSIRAIKVAGKNQNVTIEGVALNDYTNSSLGVYIQDETAGILLYDKNTPLLEDIKSGDYIRVTGTTSEYNGKFELVNLTALEKLRSDEKMIPQRLAMDTISEDYEGCLVKLSNVALEEVAEKDTYGNATLTLSKNESSLTAKLDNRRGEGYDAIISKVAVGNSVDVTGIVEDNNGKYILQLRNATDIHKTEATVGEAVAEDLFISEYVHGGGYNKAIELYNGTGKDVDLANYSIYLYTKASLVPTTSFNLSGRLENGQTYVIVHNGSTVNASLASKANIRTNKIDSLTGKNAVALAKLGKVIDLIGKLGENPDTGWVQGNASTLKHTLVRNYSVTEGTTSFTFSEWDVHENGYYDNLGSHIMKGNTLDEEPPRIEVNLEEGYNIARDLTVTAQITDERKVAGATLYYRLKGEDSYHKVLMPQKEDGAGVKIRDMYEAVIPKASLQVGTMELYVSATDGTNEVTCPENILTPFEVKLIDEDIDGPIISSYSPKKAAVLDKLSLRPTIGATFEDRTGVDVTSLVLKIDNTQIENSKITIDEKSFSYVPAEDLSLGTHKIEVTVKDKLGYMTAMSWTFTIGQVEYHHYRGQLHSHTNVSDGTGSLEKAFTYARDEGKADFFAVTDHSNWFDNDTTATLTAHNSNAWQSIKDTANKFNEEGKYVAIGGYEMTWSGSTGGWGHINTFNTKGFYSRSVSSMNLPNYYSEIAKVPESISQLNHPGTTFGDFADFGYYSEAVDAVTYLVEVGNGEGPIRSAGYFPSYEYYTRALDKGWHLSPSNNQDNHKGNWITSNDARTVILSQNLSRDSVYEAIRNHRVYATEDKNLEMNYYVNGNVMGTIMEMPETLNISITAKDPDEGDKIQKVSIIANGGTVVATKEFDENSISWDVELEPSYAYYYVRVEEADKDIAVSSPVWIGDIVPVGLSKVEASQSPTIEGENITLTATAYNNSSNALKDVKVDFYMDNMNASSKIGEGTIKSIAAGGTGNCQITWKAEKTGNYDVYAATQITYEGIEKNFSTSNRVVVKKNSEVTKVVIDTAHQNQYVSGDYQGKYMGLKGMLSDHDMILFESGNKITKETLEDVAILVITAPQRTDKISAGLTASKIEDEEIAAIADFVKRGGNLILAGRADYGDASKTSAYEYQTTVQYNKILELIDSNMRFNDDEVIDKSTNDGDTYRLNFDRFTSKNYNLIKDVIEGTKYSFYSGCSVLLKENGDETNVDWLVKGHETTESLDSDGANDATPVEMGDVNAIGAERLPCGGKVVVAGSTFFSDFEITGDDITANKAVTNTIIDWMKPVRNVVVENIADIRKDEDGDNKADRYGEMVAIEGTVMAESEAYSKAQGRSNAFFETIYVQDETAGITVFGVSKLKLPIGTKVRVTGKVDDYQGDTEIALNNEEEDIVILDANPVIMPPKFMTTGESMLEKNEGWLAKVKGEVVKIGTTSLYLDDGSGVANIFVEGYIGDEEGNKASLGKWDENIKVGDTVSAIGFCSEGLNNEKRLRVKNTSEIVKIVESSGGSAGGGNHTTSGGHSTNTQKPNTVINTEVVEKVQHISELEASEGPIVIAQSGFTMEISKDTLLLALKGQNELKIKTQVLGSKEQTMFLEKLIAEGTMKSIGSPILTVEANMEQLKNLIAMKMDVPNIAVTKANNLTAVRFITDAQGKIIAIHKLGGKYNALEKSFSFMTDQLGTFMVVEAQSLMQISLKVNERMSSVNGKQVLNDSTPMIINQRTMVPLRFVAENMGAKVLWDGKNKMATISLDDKMIELSARKTTENIETAAKLKDGRLLVPMRYIAESLESTIMWDGETKSILVVK